MALAAIGFTPFTVSAYENDNDYGYIADAPYEPEVDMPYAPEEEYPEEGYPEEGYPEEGYPEEGYPEEGYPEEGYPEEGYPEEYYPELPEDDDDDLFIGPMPLEFGIEPFVVAGITRILPPEMTHVGPVTGGKGTWANSYRSLMPGEAYIINVRLAASAAANAAHGWMRVQVTHNETGSTSYHSLTAMPGLTGAGPNADLNWLGNPPPSVATPSLGSGTANAWGPVGSTAARPTTTVGTFGTQMQNAQFTFVPHLPGMYTFRFQFYQLTWHTWNENYGTTASPIWVPYHWWVISTDHATGANFTMTVAYPTLHRVGPSYRGSQSHLDLINNHLLYLEVELRDSRGTNGVFPVSQLVNYNIIWERSVSNNMVLGGFVPGHGVFGEQPPAGTRNRQEFWRVWAEGQGITTFTARLQRVNVNSAVHGTIQGAMRDVSYFVDTVASPSTNYRASFRVHPHARRIDTGLSFVNTGVGTYASNSGQGIGPGGVLAHDRYNIQIPGLGYARLEINLYPRTGMGTFERFHPGMHVTWESSNQNVITTASLNNQNVDPYNLAINAHAIATGNTIITARLWSPNFFCDATCCNVYPDFTFHPDYVDYMEFYITVRPTSLHRINGAIINQIVRYNTPVILEVGLLPSLASMPLNELPEGWTLVWDTPVMTATPPQWLTDFTSRDGGFNVAPVPILFEPNPTTSNRYKTLEVYAFAPGYATYRVRLLDDSIGTDLQREVARMYFNDMLAKPQGIQPSSNHNPANLTYSMMAGTTRYLEVMLNPSSFNYELCPTWTNWTITWHSEDITVATVTPASTFVPFTGYRATVTAVAPTSTYIYATLRNGAGVPMDTVRFRIEVDGSYPRELVRVGDATGRYVRSGQNPAERLQVIVLPAGSELTGGYRIRWESMGGSPVVLPSSNIDAIGFIGGIADGPNAVTTTTPFVDITALESGTSTIRARIMDPNGIMIGDYVYFYHVEAHPAGIVTTGLNPREVEVNAITMLTVGFTPNTFNVLPSVYALRNDWTITWDVTYGASRVSLDDTVGGPLEAEITGNNVGQAIVRAVLRDHNGTFINEVEFTINVVLTPGPQTPAQLIRVAPGEWGGTVRHNTPTDLEVDVLPAGADWSAGHYIYWELVTGTAAEWHTVPTNTTGTVELSAQIRAVTLGYTTWRAILRDPLSGELDRMYFRYISSQPGGIVNVSSLVDDIMVGAVETLTVAAFPTAFTGLPFPWVVEWESNVPTSLDVDSTGAMTAEITGLVVGNNITVSAILLDGPGGTELWRVNFVRNVVPASPVDIELIGDQFGRYIVYDAPQMFGVRVLPAGTTLATGWRIQWTAVAVGGGTASIAITGGSPLTTYETSVQLSAVGSGYTHIYAQLMQPDSSGGLIPVAGAQVSFRYVRALPYGFEGVNNDDTIVLNIGDTYSLITALTPAAFTTPPWPWEVVWSYSPSPQGMVGVTGFANNDFTAHIVANNPGIVTFTATLLDGPGGATLGTASFIVEVLPAPVDPTGIYRRTLDVLPNIIVGEMIGTGVGLMPLNATMPTGWFIDWNVIGGTGYVNIIENPVPGNGLGITLLEGVTPGTVVVEARLRDSSGGGIGGANGIRTFYITVLPDPNAPTGLVRVGQEGRQVAVNSQINLAVTLLPAHLTSLPPTGWTIGWSSSNNAHATVSSTGVVTGVGVTGSVTITAQLYHNLVAVTGASVTFDVEVVPESIQFVFGAPTGAGQFQSITIEVVGYIPAGYRLLVMRTHPGINGPLQQVVFTTASQIATIDMCAAVTRLDVRIVSSAFDYLTGAETAYASDYWTR